jgi:hypothetical protein
MTGLRRRWEKIGRVGSDLDFVCVGGGGFVGISSLQGLFGIWLESVMVID